MPQKRVTYAYTEGTTAGQAWQFFCEQLTFLLAGSDAALALGGPRGLGGHRSADCDGGVAAAAAVCSAAATGDGSPAAPLVAALHPGGAGGSCSAVPGGACNL